MSETYNCTFVEALKKINGPATKEQIAYFMGVSVHTVYHHLKTKSNIIEEVNIEQSRRSKKKKNTEKKYRLSISFF